MVRCWGADQLHWGWRKGPWMHDFLEDVYCRAGRRRHILTSHGRNEFLEKWKWKPWLIDYLLETLWHRKSMNKDSLSCSWQLVQIAGLYLKSPGVPTGPKVRLLEPSRSWGPRGWNEAAPLDKPSSVRPAPEPTGALPTVSGLWATSLQCQPDVRDLEPAVLTVDHASGISD